MRYAPLLAMLLPLLSLFGEESETIAEFGFEQSVKPGFIWENRTGKSGLLRTRI